MEQEIFNVLTDEQERKHRELAEFRKNKQAYMESGKTGAYYSVLLFVALQTFF